MSHGRGESRMSAPFEHILVTGGCGFIGSNFVRHALTRKLTLHVTNLDLLTYSGNPENLSDVVGSHGPDGESRYHFVQADISDGDAVSRLLRSSLDAQTIVLRSMPSCTLPRSLMLTGRSWSQLHL